MSRDKAARKDIHPVTVIPAQRFAGRAADLNELVDRAAGVKVRSSGGEGSGALLSVRGLEGKRVKVYLDGHPLNTPDGSFGINDIPLQLIERIEIYKGTVPARFGGDGLGGAVNVVLKHEHRRYTDASYTFKSLGNHSTYLIHKEVWHERGIELGIGGFGTLAENRYSMARPGGPPVERTHDGFRSLVGGASLTFRRLGVDEVELETAFIRSDKELQGVPGYNQGGSQRDFRHARTEGEVAVAVLHVEDEGFLLPGLSLDYTAVTPLFRSRFIDTASFIQDFDGNRAPSLSGRGEVGAGPNLSDNRRAELRQKLILSHPAPFGTLLTLGNDFAYSFDRPRDRLADAHAGGSVSGYPGELHASTTSLTVEHGVPTSRVKLTASLKHHAFRSEGYLSDPWGYFTGVPDRVVQSRQAFGANAGVRLDLLEQLWVKASVERAHRMPTADELFGNGFAVMGSAGLKPETSTNLDVGLLWERVSGTGLRRAAEINAYAFRVENLIKLTGTIAPNHANVAEARILGVDGEVRGDVFPWLYAYANGTWLDARDVADRQPGSSQPSFTRGLRLPNMPYLFGNAGLEIHGSPWGAAAAPRFKIFWDGSAVHPFFYEFEVSRNQEKRVPGYLVHTAGIQAGFLRERYTISGEIQNLGDAERFDQFNNPLPGRVFRAKLRVTVF